MYPVEVRVMFDIAVEIIAEVAAATVAALIRRLFGKGKGRRV